MHLPSLVGAAVGLIARYWWAGQTDATVERYTAAVRANVPLIGLAAAAALGLFAVYLWRHTEPEPWTGGRRLFLFNDRTLERVAECVAQATLDSTRPLHLDAADPVYKRVAGVTSRMLAANSSVDAIRRRRWTLVVVDSPNINATAMPSGLVMVYTGLAAVANDDQLSIFVGHELAHCLLRHVNQINSVAVVVNALCLAPVTAVVCAALPLGWNVLAYLLSVAALKVCFVLPFVRLYESEADRVGLRLAANACVDVAQGYLFFDARSERDGCASKLFWWLYMHPTNRRRARHLYSLIPRGHGAHENVISARSMCSFDIGLIVFVNTIMVE
ncbi:metalloendopeptidase OMA1, mitochondrial-like [Rhopalosiphum maidis]|uniref:metalloendopeptidase OMA1, mitochondrial-like n=1 Tax=Rhopalosiphum maidis TaxID=43146 RepID=UPI000EFDB974|nr:metalloendopeptidase OMA1, mitochondrial-like [Rhopalosiphum maidis]